MVQLEGTVSKYFGASGYYCGVDMDARVVFDRYTPRDSISEYYSPDDPELEQSVTGFNDIGECAMMELLHEMETGEEIQ